jgi:glycosyltransferase involved in cell wall biosynthesis
MSPNLLVVSAAYAPNRAEAGPGPRKDYAALAATLEADVLDRTAVEHAPFSRALARLLGVPAAQAWLAFRQRHAYRSIVTDGEHIGIPLALLLKLAGATIPHVTIGHRLTAAKKRPFFRWLRVQTHLTRIVLHARRQHQLARDELDIPERQLALIPYQVDTDFWRPQPVAEERLICSAGLEFRDYPSLMQAVDGLDVRVVIGAASHWSRRASSAAGAACPPNVTVDAFDYTALRDLYARSAIVVVPLDDVDFQAGVTSILEAMAMAKPVVVTHSWGQTDVVEDRRAVTRGNPPRPRPVSLLRLLAQREGVALEPNGFYVPPEDPAALRRALIYLLDRPDERERLGAAGRRAVERLLRVDQFAARMRALVDDACASALPGPSTDRPAARWPDPAVLGTPQR